MESNAIRNGFRRAITSSHNPARRRAFHQSTRCLATPTEPQGEIRAAPVIRFSSNNNQFSRHRPQAQLIDDEQSSPRPRGTGSGQRNLRRGGRSNGSSEEDRSDGLLRRVRIVPASPSYFTALPKHTDDILYLSSLLLKYQLLPTMTPAETPPVKFRSRLDYQVAVQEPVRSKSYNNMRQLLLRLHRIHPSLIPDEVTEALDRYKALVQPNANAPKPIVVDEHGRARAVGRRKSSSAVVYLVEGEGECLINGRSLTEYFGRLHDRESAVWALKATQRLDKYNVWALAKGGGTTGQADAITLGVAKALLAHEPDLKPALRRAGVVTRDMRRVERKKPGKLKARKMPAWVKR